MGGLMYVDPAIASVVFGVILTFFGGFAAYVIRTLGRHDTALAVILERLRGNGHTVKPLQNILREETKERKNESDC